MWPKCINNLSPIKIKDNVKDNFSEEMAKLLKVTFNKKGIFNEDEMFMPIRIVNILGCCNVGMYFDCPNTPDYHLYEATGDEDYDAGRYFWLDFDIVGMDGLLLPLRMVFNEGEADSNDGFWGVVWDRDTEEIIANIINSGDCETTIEAISKQHINMYESQEILIPTIFDSDEGGLLDDIIPAQGTKLEKIIRLTIQFFYEYIGHLHRME